MASPANGMKCTICSRPIESGQGQEIFTAECAHSLNFSSISNSVTYGNYLCPLCPPKDLPFTVNTNVNSSFGSNPVDPVPEPQLPVCSSVMLEPEPILFSDDEPLLVVTVDPVSAASSGDQEDVRIEAIPERVAVASSESVSDFDVLLKIMAPGLLVEPIAAIDLVAVIDASGSMHGPKLELLKSAVVFVIDKLRPYDRLSIVAFSTHARRILPLRRMTEHGRENAKQCVNSLYASGSTNIVEALEKGVQVLEERRHPDPVSSIIFLSDGKDTCYRGSHIPCPRQPPQYLHLLPASIYPENRGTEDNVQQQTFPVHGFAFGADHDRLSMTAISRASDGHFSFIESYETVEDIFGLCIGFQQCVLAQELHLIVRSASHGVQIRSVLGRYASEISNEGSRALINVGDYGEQEEQELLVHLSIPVFPGVEDDENDSNTTMPLLDITCSYIVVDSNDMIQIDGDQVTIRRPRYPSPLETRVSLEFARKRNYLSAEQGLREAKLMAVTGDFTGAGALLSNLRSALLASASWKEGDGLSLWIECKLKHLAERIENMQLYDI